MSRTPAGIKALLAIVHACVGLCDNSEHVHERVFATANFNDTAIQFPYNRFNVDRDMDKIRLDEWKKMQEMVALTHNYLSEGAIRRQINLCVEWVLRPPEFLCK